MKTFFFTICITFIFSSIFAQENILDSSNFKISITSINTKGDDITPFINNGTFYYLSEQSSDFSEHLNIFSLRKASIGEDNMPFDSKAVDEIFGTDPSGGPIAISPDGNNAIFAKEVHLKHLKTKEKYKFYLFSTTKDSSNTWSTPVQLPFDDEHYSCSHPTINADFTKMYFVSDNKDGKGGADIWYTEFKNGAWQEPIDLGKKINTNGKEVFPYLYDDNTLFFASNGLDDSENLDLYMATIDGADIRSIKRLPFPINTPDNDFSISFSEDKKYGYFCSDREKINGDDIFYFNFKNTVKKKH